MTLPLPQPYTNKEKIHCMHAGNFRSLFLQYSKLKFPAVFLPKTEICVLWAAKYFVGARTSGRKSIENGQRIACHILAQLAIPNSVVILMCMVLQKEGAIQFFSLANNVAEVPC